jgi:DNA-binding CsgD family transcriptional regulator/pimeloyl-ACP methyl ester carboxylesterase
MDHYQRDIEAVVDHLRLERFILYGALFHLSYVPTQYAVEHPDRVKALILVGVGSSLAAYRVPALFDTLPAQDWDLFLRFLVTGGGQARSDEAERWISAWGQALNQHDFLLLARLAASSAIGPLLERLTTPTLVLQPRDFSLLAPEEPAKVARLARAKLVTIDGKTVHVLDVDQAMRAIDALLAGLPETEAASGDRPGDLSPRELEVLRLLAHGKSNPEIAKELFITRNTVQNHVGSILTKTNLNNRTEAAVYARDHGIA